MAAVQEARSFAQHENWTNNMGGLIDLVEATYCVNLPTASDEGIAAGCRLS
jgi:hypothetical protein